MREHKICPQDNVVVRGHDKFAAKDISAGETIIKYGFPIGAASQNICKGEFVHTHNLISTLSPDSKYVRYEPFSENKLSEEGSFLGFRRKDGKVGIRNDIYVLPAVGCVNGICERLARETGAIALTHALGCSQLGDDLENTRKILRGLACHPNAAGVLVVSLGCENNTPKSFREFLLDSGADEERVRFLTIQESADEIAEGKRLIGELSNKASELRAEPVSLSELTIGLKCGGSDGLSGITANPLVGKISDKMIRYGGSAILTEIPEMFGAENILLKRCSDFEVYNRLCDTIDRFKQYYRDHGNRIDENPSPGNKEGGITTLAEKSLGCVQKGGTSAIMDVISYGERIRKKGLTVLEAPGNDIVACTALMAAGANLILFTTGRGTPLGCGVPVLKISSNSELFTHKPNWIDFDAGTLIHGDPGAENRLFELVLQTAQGRKTRNEINGNHEIAIWKNGVTL